MAGNMKILTTGGMPGFNDIRLNDLGFPIIPEREPVQGKKKALVSDSVGRNTRLKGFVEDPNYFSRPAKARGIIDKYFGIPYPILRKIAREFVVFASMIKLRKNEALFYQNSQF